MKVVFALLTLFAFLPSANAHVMLRGLLTKIVEQPTLPKGCTVSFDEVKNLVKVKNEFGVSHEFKVGNLDREVSVASGRNGETWLGGDYSDDVDFNRYIHIALSSENQLVALRVIDRSVESEGPTLFHAECRN